jgi:hypothetical protein
MFATFAAAVSLTLTPAQGPAAPAPGGTLNLANARASYGEMGAVRTDNRYLPGDFFFLAFDMEGLAVSPEGKVSYTMTVEVTDKAGKPVFKQDKPAENDEFIVLGGNRLPGRAWVALKPDQEPGTYSCKVTVTDRVTKATKTLQRSFDVAKKEFGLIGIMTTYDAKGEIPAPPSGVVGQILYIHGAVTAFGRGADKKPNASVELRILDESKRPTIAKPQAVMVPKDIPDGNDMAFITLVIPLNREGAFTAEVKATDATTGKTASVSFPIRSLPPTK